MTHPAVLHTRRLSLRELTPADAAFVLRLLNEPSFLRYIGDRGVRNLDDARDYIRDRIVASYAAHGFGLYGVVRRGGDRLLGICGLLKRDVLDDVDLGFAFLPEHWSRGYAYEAASAVLGWAADELGLERVVAVTVPDNEASLRLLRKLGFRYEGKVRLSADEPEIELHGRRLLPPAGPATRTRHDPPG